MASVEGRLLIDTSVLIYATLENDRRSERSRQLLLSRGDQEKYVSVQNLAEMYPNLTGPRMAQPDSPGMARVKIESIASLPTLQVLPLTGDVQKLAMELCEKHRLTRRRYYDAQLVATMVAHGIRTIVTENTRDFEGMPEIEAIDPFRA